VASGLNPQDLRDIATTDLKKLHALSYMRKKDILAVKFVTESLHTHLL